MNTAFSVLLVLAAVSALLVLHELGHLVVGLLCRVRAGTFTFGLGPRLLRAEICGVDVAVRLFPICASVQYADRSDPSQNVYIDAPRWKRGLIDLAGPMANYAAACVLVFTLTLAGWLTPAPRAVVVSVEPGSMAARTGVHPGDVITHLQGEDINAEELQSGLRLQQEPVPQPLSTALRFSLFVPLELTRDQLLALNDLVFRAEFAHLQGPLGVGRSLMVEVQRGVFSFVSAIVVLSIAIGFFNLLPIPGLDGGKLLLNAFEAVRRRPLPPHAVARVQAVSLSSLLVLIAALGALESDYLWLGIPCALGVPLAVGACVGAIRPRPTLRPWRAGFRVGIVVALLALICGVIVAGPGVALLLALPVVPISIAAGCMSVAGYRWSATRLLVADAAL